MWLTRSRLQAAEQHNALLPLLRSDDISFLHHQHLRLCAKTALCMLRRTSMHDRLHTLRGLPGVLRGGIGIWQIMHSIVSATAECAGPRWPSPDRLA